MTVWGRWEERDGEDRTQQETLADRAGASWRGRSVVRWVAQAPTLPSGRKWNRSQSSEGAIDLLLPRSALGKMQGQPACGAGEPSGQGEEPPPEGLGGGYPLSRTDPRRPASQVVGHRLDGQPGAVGGEAPRGEMVQPDAVLEVAYRILDLGVAAMVGLQFEGLPLSTTSCRSVLREAISRTKSGGFPRSETVPLRGGEAFW